MIYILYDHYRTSLGNFDTESLALKTTDAQLKEERAKARDADTTRTLLQQEGEKARQLTTQIQEKDVQLRELATQKQTISLLVAKIRSVPP